VNSTWRVDLERHIPQDACVERRLGSKNAAGIELVAMQAVHPFANALACCAAGWHLEGRDGTPAALEATQGQNDSFFFQLPYKCYLEEVASVGD